MKASEKTSGSRSVDPTDASEAIRFLRTYRDQCNAVSDGIGDKNSLSAGARRTILSAYAGLKSDLREDDKRLTSHPANQIEREYVQPAIRDACSELRARINVNPLKSNLRAELIQAVWDINHYLRQLEELFPEL